MRKFYKLVLVLLFAVVVYKAISYEGPIYVGPEMQTETGGKYFCTFETKDVFFEYMQEKSK